MNGYGKQGLDSNEWKSQARLRVLTKTSSRNP